MDKKDLPCQAGRDQGVKYELVEKSDDIVFCHRLFQEVFAYHHVVSCSPIPTEAERLCASSKKFFAMKKILYTKGVVKLIEWRRPH